MYGLLRCDSLIGASVDALIDPLQIDSSMRGFVD